jgi:hypothetical protein
MRRSDSTCALPTNPRPITAAFSFIRLLPIFQIVVNGTVAGRIIENIPEKKNGQPPWPAILEMHWKLSRVS